MAVGIQYIIRLRMARDRVPFRALVEIVEAVGGEILVLDVVRADDDHTIRDLTVVIPSADQLDPLEHALAQLPGTAIDHVSDRTLLMHLGGKIEIHPRIQVKTRADLSHSTRRASPGWSQRLQRIPPRRFS